MGKGKKKGVGNSDNPDQPPQKSSQKEQNPQQQSDNRPIQGQQRTQQPKKENPLIPKDQPVDKQNEPSTSKQGDQDKKNKNGWDCKCGFKNFGKKTLACKQCSEPKPGEKATEVTAEQKQSVPKSQPITQESKPSAVISQQPEQKPIEKQQNVPKQVDKDVKRGKGDWECKCGYRNFAKKPTCKKCSEPRPQEKVVEQPAQSSSTQQQRQQSIEQPSSQRPSTAGIPDMQRLNISSGGGNGIETSPNGRVFEGTRGVKCTVEVNYATIGFRNLPKDCFHYDVTFNPDTPKKMLPAALHTFMREFFAGCVYGFDGRKNMYTPKKLLIKGKEAKSHSGKITATLQDRKKEFDITVQYAATVDMSVLLNYKDPMYQNEEKPSTAIQVLDVILRSAFRRNIDGGTAIQAGRAVYFVPNKKMDLGDGMELWYGLFQSVLLGRARLYLNVDVLHKAFPSNIPLLEYLKTFNRDGRVPDRLNPYQKETLREYLAMLTVGYRINSSEPLKNYSFNGVGSEASSATFEHNNIKMTVQTYFERVKGVKLRFPNLPVLWVGSREKRIYLPIEFCEIPAGQATNKKCTPNCVRGLIRFSATSTDIRKQKIKDLLSKISYETDPTITGFGIQIDKNFQKTDARVIDPPQLKYSNQTVEVSRGVWKEGIFLETSRNSIKWNILCVDERTNIQALDDLKRNIMNVARRQNIILDNLQTAEIKKISLRDNKLQYVLNDMKNAGYKLVIVVVNDRDTSYSLVKQAAELSVGILTQCIKANTVATKLNPSTLNNILLKLNAKLNGKNHEIEEMSYKAVNAVNSGVMFVGADVTHPSPDQKDIPSVVGVASSYDQVGFRYCCAWRLQDPKKEMIEDLEDILVESLKYYAKANGTKLPRKILYYRDGVSDGQFKEVLNIEMTAIRGALRRIYGQNPPAQVTFIIVQKRHHTRFFPTNKQFSDGRNNNIVPGTVVDKDIVHPFQNQFFLASHAAIQGVTKPTKYCILINECGINPDDLQAITYDLCHLFTRCSRSVSYPAPTYYAHLVAARGKNYIIGSKLQMMNLKREYQCRQINPSIIQNSPMFFV